jgi:hypothetical protein
MEAVNKTDAVVTTTVEQSNRQMLQELFKPGLTPNQICKIIEDVERKGVWSSYDSISPDATTVPVCAQVEPHVTKNIPTDNPTLKSAPVVAPAVTSTESKPACRILNQFSSAFSTVGMNTAASQLDCCKFALRRSGCRFRETCQFHHGDAIFCNCASLSCNKAHLHRVRGERATPSLSSWQGGDFVPRQPVLLPTYPNPGLTTNVSGFYESRHLETQRDLPISNWLQDKGLQNYSEGFIREGYDTVGFLADADKGEIMNLLVAVGMKGPHRKRFENELTGLESATDDEGIVEALVADEYIYDESVSDRVQWKWQATHDGFVAYDMENNAAIEQAYMGGQTFVKIFIRRDSCNYQPPIKCTFGSRCRFRKSCSFHHGEIQHCDCTSVQCKKAHAERARASLPEKKQSIEMQEYVIDFKNMAQSSPGGAKVAPVWSHSVVGSASTLYEKDTAETIEAKYMQWHLVTTDGCQNLDGLCDANNCKCHKRVVTLIAGGCGGTDVVLDFKLWKQATCDSKVVCNGNRIRVDRCNSCADAKRDAIGVKCDDCNGTKVFRSGRKSIECRRCHGTGKFRTKLQRGWNPKHCLHCSGSLKLRRACYGCSKCDDIVIKREDTAFGLRSVLRVDLDVEASTAKEEAKLAQAKIAEVKKEAEASMHEKELAVAKLESKMELEEARRKHLEILIVNGSQYIQWLSCERDAHDVLHDAEMTAALEAAYQVYANEVAIRIPSSCSIDVARVTIGSTCYQINFLTMKQENLKTGFKRQVRRHTPSAPIGVCTSQLVQWLYDGDDGQDSYSSAVSNSLEAAYQNYQQNLMSALEPQPEVQLENDAIFTCCDAGGIKYEINFDKMQQRNIKTGNGCAIRRKVKDGFPSNWSPQLKSNSCMQVHLSQGSTEWQEVASKMRETMPTAVLHSIHRIQNPDLFSYYTMRKARLEKTLGATPTEVEVWHGSANTDPRLIYEDQQDGFMTQYSSKGMWGSGIYFAENASYSNTYAFSSKEDKKRTFMLVNLLVGDAKRIMPNDSSLRFPPQKPGCRMRYDTVTGETGGSKVYIVYENGRAYPAYKLVYTP